MESVNIATDHENTTFFDYLGVTLKDDGSDYEVVTLKGSCAGCSEILKYYYLGGVSPHYKVDRLQSDGAMLLMNSEEGYGRMFLLEGPGYNVISSSVVLGAIANADSLNIKPYLVSEFVNYFIGYNPVTSLTENVDRIFTGKVYPNPFKDRATISFTLSQQEHVTVSIHDLQGQLVKTLADGRFLAGTHEISWNGANEASVRMNPGYYIVTIRDGQSVRSKKLVFLPQGAD